jgi:hypothetical protein
LYSVRDIGRDELISEHPVQLIPARQYSHLRGAGLEDLCFDWDDGKQARVAVALGAGAFIGHSSEPNCFWKADRSNRTIAIHPRRPIFAGEELTIDYATDTRRPCRGLGPSAVPRLAAELLPRPEAPKAVVISDPSFGRTLITVRDIAAGENLGEAPARVIPTQALEEFGKVDALTDLSHTWGYGLPALVLGLPAMVNHSNAANAFYKENRKRRTISLVAYRDIPAGHEVSMNYNGHPDDKSPLDWQPSERAEPFTVSLIR